jgi:hypothetical protein
VQYVQLKITLEGLHHFVRTKFAKKRVTWIGARRWWEEAASWDVLESIENLIAKMSKSPSLVVIVSLSCFILSGNVLLPFLELVARHNQMTDVLYCLTIV